MDVTTQQLIMGASGHGAAPPVSPATFVGVSTTGVPYSGYDASTYVRTFPAGTQAGDLAIIVWHTQAGQLLMYQSCPPLGSPYTPFPGYTQIAVPNSVDGEIPQTYYARRAWYKVLTASDVTNGVQIPAGLFGFIYEGSCYKWSASFELDLFVLRGHTRIDAYAYLQYAGSSGSSSTLSVPRNGSLIAIASDRGATSEAYPSISPSAGAEYHYGATYSAFSNRYLVETNYTAGALYTFTDYSDSYPTSALMLVTA